MKGGWLGETHPAGAPEAETAGAGEVDGAVAGVGAGREGAFGAGEGVDHGDDRCDRGEEAREERPKGDHGCRGGIVCTACNAMCGVRSAIRLKWPKAATGGGAISMRSTSVQPSIPALDKTEL